MTPRWIIAGGGTGGHLYPGLAIAEALRERSPAAEILFVGTKRGIESRVVPAQGFKLETIDVEGIKNRGLLALLKAAIQVPLSILQSIAIIRRFKPTAVLGVGGYASGPVGLAAWLLRVPVAVQEQNAYPGLTNRWLGKIARAVFTSWPDTRGFDPRRIVPVGNPIRASIQPHMSEGTVTVLVFGGSQGARSINQAMASAAPALADLGDRLEIIHQTGRDTAVDVEGAYRNAGIRATVQQYFDDMPNQYLRSSLAVCRAGATSLAELAAAGLPAILVPFPFAAENHQEKNADVFVARGAALKVLNKDATGERMAQIIRGLAEHPGRLKEMSQAMASMARPNAAQDLVDRWLTETGQNKHV
jgi:UDP-N-acetylglucosamine--N-acetylmuramyl-(pentapeptide) pyrophosphoryl-undecaprenol N-acetylglucosamine transferase